MYAIFYLFITFSGLCFIFNNKNNKYFQNLSLVILTNIILIFFLFNDISADKAYYNLIYLNDYFLGFQRQGFDTLFYYFAHLISIFQNTKIPDFILYISFLCSLYFFSKKFKNPLHIILMFFPYTLVAIMQGFPRQAWAMMLIIIACNLFFYVKETNINSLRQIFLKFYIFFILLIAVFFHYSSIIFLGIYILYTMSDLKIKYFYLSIPIALAIVFYLYSYNYLDVYFEKLRHIQDFSETRVNYSLKGFSSRFFMILLPALFILYSYLSNLKKKNIKVYPIDKFFFLCSFVYICCSFIVLNNLKLIIMLDRLNIYFFLITIYFFGRFIFFSFNSKKFQNILVLISLVYLNFYLILWIFFSKSYYEFRYNFQLF